MRWLNSQTFWGQICHGSRPSSASAGHAASTPNYCVPALSALGIPIWYSFLQMCCSFWQIDNRFQFPWNLSVAHAFNIFRSFVKRLKVLDLELSITKQIILKTCVYLSKKSQVLIWQVNFHLPAAVFLQIYSLNCSHEKLKIYLSQKIPAFSFFTAKKYVQLLPLFQRVWFVVVLKSLPGLFLKFFFFFKGSYFSSLGVMMNRNLWMQFCSDSRVKSWVPLAYVQESNHVHVRGLAVALEIPVLFPILHSCAMLPAHFFYKSK